MTAIDRRALERLRSAIGNAAYPVVLDVFLEDLPRLQTDIAESLRAADVDDVKRVAHELKGVAMIFGDETLAQSCRELIDLKPPGVDGAAEVWVGRVIKLCTKAIRAIEAERDACEPVRRASNG